MTDEVLTANPKLLKMWSENIRCWMCRHKFSNPTILPVEKPERGKFQPNINGSVLFHLKDTHGMEPEIVSSWITGSIYGSELTLFGAKDFMVDL